MFLALDAPGTTRSTMVFVYAVAIAENALLYAFIGVITWFAVIVLNKLRHPRR
jgi:hypothetical protein